MKSEMMIKLLKTVYPVVRPVIISAIENTDNEIDDTIFEIFDLLIGWEEG